MADNTTPIAGGDTISTDDVGAGVKVQRVKVQFGADGTAFDVTSAIGLPTQDLTNSDFLSTGAGSQLTLNNNVLLASAGAGAFDALLYRAMALQINVAAGTVTAGAITFEGSNDSTNWTAFPLYDVASVSANPVTTYTLAAATPRFFMGPIPFRYVRARISTAVTGTTTGVQAICLFRAVEHYSPQQVVTQQTAANLNMTVGGGTLPTVTTVGTVTTVASQTPVAPTQSATVAAASTNATSVKASAGTAWSIVGSSLAAYDVFLKLYNKASAPTVGTDVPVMTIRLVAGGLPTVLEGGANGFRFATGIAFAITKLIADSDTTVLVAGDAKVLINYT